MARLNLWISSDPRVSYILVKLERAVSKEVVVLHHHSELRILTRQMVAVRLDGAQMVEELLLGGAEELQTLTITIAVEPQHGAQPRRHQIPTTMEVKRQLGALILAHRILTLPGLMEVELLILGEFQHVHQILTLQIVVAELQDGMVVVPTKHPTRMANQTMLGAPPLELVQANKLLHGDDQLEVQLLVGGNKPKNLSRKVMDGARQHKTTILLIVIMIHG